MDSTKKNSDNAVNGYKKEDFKEIQIPMPWGQISGKWWGPRDQQPIVAIHGWQDNSGSFDNLAQLLPSNIAMLSIDLPGHGFSSHLPYGQFYYVFWDGVIALRRIIKYYKWNKANGGALKSSNR